MSDEISSKELHLGSYIEDIIKELNITQTEFLKAAKNPRVEIVTPNNSTSDL